MLVSQNLLFSKYCYIEEQFWTDSSPLTSCKLLGFKLISETETQIKLESPAVNCSTGHAEFLLEACSTRKSSYCKVKSTKYVISKEDSSITNRSWSLQELLSQLLEKTTCPKMVMQGRWTSKCLELSNSRRELEKEIKRQLGNGSYGTDFKITWIEEEYSLKKVQWV